MEVNKMEEDEQKTMKEIFGNVIYAYTRAQAIEEGTLIDVSESAREAGINFPTALTSAVWADYVAVPAEMKGHQDEMGRLWDVLWMFSWAVRSGRITGATGAFEVIIAKPDKGDWRENEKAQSGNRDQRLVTLKAVCGPSDDGSSCVTIMRPEED
jgi:hypothetical protein